MTKHTHLVVLMLGGLFGLASSFTVSFGRDWTVSNPPVAFGVSSVLNMATLPDEEKDLVPVPRKRRRGRIYEDEDEDKEFFDEVERRIYGEQFDDEDEDWDEDDEYDDEEEYDLFSDVLIDNPILDSIDPDGAAERFPELARDPRFWFDMVLFIAFLNWLSAIGPQDYFPDIPYYV